LISGLFLNFNLIKNHFIQVLRTDGKFEEDRFIIKKKKELKNVEVAEVKLNVIKLKDQVTDLITDSRELNEISCVINEEINRVNTNHDSDENGMKEQEALTKCDKFTEMNVINQENDEIKDIMVISVRDYFADSHRDLSDWDDRSFLQYFWDVLEYQNLFFYAFFRRSLLTPYYIRITLFFIQLDLFFLLNCMMYTDYYIDKRLDDLTLVKE
jgi:hypothetical protein